MLQLKTLVVGVDFSQPSGRAALWVARYFAPKAEVVLVHAVEVPRPPSFLGKEFPHEDEIAKTLSEGAESRLLALRDSLPGEQVSIEVRPGEPSQVLAEVAAEVEAELIVVGEHGKRSGIWKLLGSTAERLIQSTVIPILIARNLPDATPHTVLAAVEEDQKADRVLQWGRLIGDAHDAYVIVLHIARDLLSTIKARAVRSAAEARQVQESVENRSRNWLQGLVKEAGFSEEKAAIQVRSGQPSHEILAAAARFSADLVIMGGHRGGRLKAMFIGSVTRSVIQATSSSVLIVSRDDG